MSEYWKSTERYWCKHCKLYVKDTKIERQNHDASPRHQGNLKRFVRDLHRNNEKDEREKQRAKDEVARLNGIVSGGSFSRPGSTSFTPMGPASSKLQPQVSRKEQLQQLVDLGVSLPDEFRKELSMTGEWQTVSETPIDPGAAEKKPDAIGYGVRKRENPEEEEEEGKEIKRRRWESTHKTHNTGDEDDDLDALFIKGIRRKDVLIKSELIAEGSTDASSAKIDIAPKLEADADTIISNLKEELSDDTPRLLGGPSDPQGKQDVLADTGGVLFKKRAKKNIRQK